MKITAADIYDISLSNEKYRSIWNLAVVRLWTDEGIYGIGEVGLAYGVGQKAGLGMLSAPYGGRQPERPQAENQPSPSGRPRRDHIFATNNALGWNPTVYCDLALFGDYLLLRRRTINSLLYVV